MSSVKYCEKCLVHEGAVLISAIVNEIEDEEFEVEEPEDNGEGRRLADGDNEESEEKEEAIEDKIEEKKEEIEEQIEEKKEEIEEKKEELEEKIEEKKEEIEEEIAEAEDEEDEQEPEKPAPRYQTRQVVRRSENIMTEKIEVSSSAGVQQEISGTIIDESGGLGGVQATAVIPGCEKVLATMTNKAGDYTIKLPTKADFSPYNVELIFSIEGY